MTNKRLSKVYSLFYLFNPSFITLWNNTHTTTLEEYGLKGSVSELYHPEALDLGEQQLEAELQALQRFNKQNMV